MKAQLNAPAMLVLGLVLVASGCTTGTDDEPTDVSVEQESGVKIQSFDIQRSQVREGDTINPRMKVKNRGGREAKSAKAILYNYPSGWGDENAEKLEFGDIVAPDPERNRPSRPARDSTDIKVNSDYRQGQNIPVDIKAALAYNYTTIADTSVIVAPRNQAPSSASASEVDNTAGPVQLDVVSQPLISIDKENGDTSGEVPMCVEVKNVGDGTPLLRSQYSTIGDLPLGNVDEDINAVKVTADASNSQILSFSSGSTETNTKTKTLRMYDSTATTKCWDLEADVDPNFRESTERLNLEAKYAYRVKDSIGVSVVGREGSP
jgi:hypothetical protein